jgi:hypothetical protein
LWFYGIGIIKSSDWESLRTVFISAALMQGIVYGIKMLTGL